MATATYVQACDLEAADRIDIDGRTLTVLDRHQLGAWGIELELTDDANTTWTDHTAARTEYQRA